MRARCGDVLIVGAVFARTRLEGMLSAAQGRRPIRRLALHGALPGPLRTAHLIAGGVAQDESRRRVRRFGYKLA